MDLFTQCEGGLLFENVGPLLLDLFTKCEGGLFCN